MVWFVIRFQGRGIEEKGPRQAWWQRLLGQGPEQITGFFTTRFVNAEYAAAAEDIARSLVLDELCECGLFDLSHLELLVDEIWTVLESEADPEAKGFSFYARDE